MAWTALAFLAGSAPLAAQVVNGSVVLLPPLETTDIGQQPPKPKGELIPALTQAVPLNGEPTPSSVALEQAPADGSCAAGGATAALAPPVFTWERPGPDFWQKNPPYRIFPRLGNFFFAEPPTGPGYYTVLDLVLGREKQRRTKFPYARFGVQPWGYFDADFRYLDDPNNEDRDWSDFLHRIHIGDKLLLNTGGEVRWMYMNFTNFNLTGKDDSKNLLRERVYGDAWWGNTFRLYVEMLDAHSLNHVLPSPASDVDQADLLNAFIDVKVFDFLEKPTYIRAGRQQVYLGSQRLIGQLDWSNVNRAFQGVRGFRQGEKLDIDAFWLQPLIIDPTHFDWVDPKQTLTGLWTTYRPKKGNSIDVYNLFASNRNPITKLGITSGPYDVNTMGARYAGTIDNGFLWDVEGMMQFGTEGGTHDIIAGAATTGAGWHWKDTAWTPTFWSYFDYASGDPNPGKHNSSETFNQLYPFGHYYLGWLDIVGRQNILDPNLHLFFYPTKFTTVWLQYHHFWLASPKDALYNASGTPILRDPTGKAGQNVGDEFDFILNFTLSVHSNVLVNYDILNAGRFVRTLSKKPNADTINVMYVFRW